jgi:hypothetical protein
VRIDETSANESIAAPNITARAAPRRDLSVALNKAVTAIPDQGNVAYASWRTK